VDVFGSNGKVGTHDVEWLKAPGVVVGRKGTVGAIHFADRPYWPIDTAYYGRPTAGDNLRFLYYLLEFLPLALLNAATGVPGLSRRDAYALRGAFPPDPEQARIADILGALDEEMERTLATERQAGQLERGLFSDLLSCGMLPSGQLRDRARDAHEFVATKLGSLPIAWELSDIGTEFAVQNGITLNEERRLRLKRHLYLRVANVRRYDLSLDDVQVLGVEETELAQRLLEHRDLLVVEGHADRMQIGRCALVSPEATGMTFQNHLFRLRSRGRVRPEFGNLWMNSAYSQRYWNSRCGTSSGLNTINQRNLRQLVIPVPPEPEQRAISELADCHRTYQDSLSRRFDALRTLKRSLMSDLLTGRIQVGDARTAQAITR
jgi:type I restriction enzyme S subunit